MCFEGCSFTTAIRETHGTAPTGFQVADIPSSSRPKGKASEPWNFFRTEFVARWIRRVVLLAFAFTASISLNEHVIPKKYFLGFFSGKWCCQETPDGGGVMGRIGTLDLLTQGGEFLVQLLVPKVLLCRLVPGTALRKIESWKSERGGTLRYV